MKNKLLLVLLILLSCKIYSQTQKITWLNLAEVKFEKTFLESYGDYFLTPDFEESIKDLEGKKIEIKGFVLNLIGDGKTFLLSKQPMASCFFCGMAGPETIMELHFNENKSLETDQIIFVEGVLELNKDDANHCIFILKNAKIIKE